MKQESVILSFLFTFLLGGVSQLQAQDAVSIKIEVDDPYQHGGRSLQAVPAATLDGVELNLQFPFATESQVVIVDQGTQTIVFSGTFTAARSVVIDLEDEGIGEGTYTLHVYAFGKWWWGEFEILDYNL